MADQPQLGYGQRGEASLDAFNQWFRSRPEYYAKLAEFGQDPTNVHLNDAQKQEMIRLAQSLGAVVDEGHNGQEVDDSGNFRAKSHALRNTLIVAGIAGAALLTAGAAGAFGGAAAGGGAGAGAVSEGTLASLGGVGAAAADVGAGALAPAVAGGAGMAGVEGGAFGLGEGALAGLGTGAMGAAAVPAGVGAAAVDAASAGGAWDAAGNFIGPSSVSSVAGGGIGSVLKGIASSSWFPAALGVAGQLGGAAIQANQSEKAAAIQAQSAKEALDFAKSQAALEQKNFAPYLAAGTGALSKLSYGLGIGEPGDYNANGMPATPPGGSPGSITPVGDPQVSPKSPAAQFINSTRTQPVWMMAPTGERSQVPANQVQHYLSLGAKLEPGQGLDGGSVPRPNSLAMLGRMAPAGADISGTAAPRV